jgi:hypothetical protein
MIESLSPTDAPAPGAMSRVGVPTAAKVAFRGIAPAPDAARAS